MFINVSVYLGSEYYYMCGSIVVFNQMRQLYDGRKCSPEFSPNNVNHIITLTKYNTFKILCFQEFCFIFLSSSGICDMFEWCLSVAQNVISPHEVHAMLSWLSVHCDLYYRQPCDSYASCSCQVSISSMITSKR